MPFTFKAAGYQHPKGTSLDKKLVLENGFSLWPGQHKNVKIDFNFNDLLITETKTCRRSWLNDMRYMSTMELLFHETPIECAPFRFNNTFIQFLAQMQGRCAEPSKSLFSQLLLLWHLWTWIATIPSFRLELIPHRGGFSHSDPSSPLLSISSMLFL